MKTNVQTRTLGSAAILFGLCFMHQAHAQSNVTAHAAVGRSDIEVHGLGLLDVITPYIKPITQYTVGIQYEKDFTRHLAFITGGQYTSRGFGARESFNVDVFGLELPLGASIETRLNYIEVPLMLKYNITDGGITPYIQAGASAAYALNGKMTPKVEALISWRLPSIDINLENDMYNRFDVSALVGAGVMIPTNEFGSFRIEATYRHSLNDMFLDNITDIRIKSHGFAVGIGYAVRF